MREIGSKVKDTALENIIMPTVENFKESGLTTN